MHVTFAEILIVEFRNSCPKYEIRSTKSETNDQIQNDKARNGVNHGRVRFERLNFLFGCLFRISCFVLRVSAALVSGIVTCKRAGRQARMGWTFAVWNHANFPAGRLPQKTGETEGGPRNRPCTAAPKLKRPEPFTGWGCSGTVMLSAIIYRKHLRKTNKLEKLISGEESAKDSSKRQSITSSLGYQARPVAAEQPTGILPGVLNPLTHPLKIDRAAGFLSTGTAWSLCAVRALPRGFRAACTVDKGLGCPFAERPRWTNRK